MRKAENKFLFGGGVLAICSILAKLLGALFRVPLTNIVGAEGMGLYQMVFPLYTVLLTLTSGGLTSSISKLLAQNKENKGNLSKILWVSVICVLIVSSLATMLLLIFRDSIASMQGNSKAGLAYLAIAPAIILVSLISCFRGYFQGLNNMFFSGISQLLEQIVKLVLGLYLASRLLIYGVEYAVFGALIGVSASELVAFIYLLFHYYLAHLKNKKRSIISLKMFNKLLNSEMALELGSEYFFARDFMVAKNGEVVRSLYKVALPITLGSLIMPLTQVIDSVMVINVLSQMGVDRVEATALFGLVSGPISSLINMPLVITLSLCVSLLPKIATKFSKKLEIDSKIDDKIDNKIDGLVALGIKNVLIFSLPCALVFLFFSKEVVKLLYAGGLNQNQIEICSVLLKIESVSIVFVSIIQLCSAVLQGADKASTPALNMLLGAIAKVLLTLILLPILGIKGTAIASMLCYLFIASLDLFHVKRISKIKFSFKPIVFSFLFILISRGLYLVLSGFLLNSYALVISLGFGALIYLAFLLISKSLNILEFFRM